MCPDNHQHDPQTPYKPQYLFSVCVPFAMKLFPGPLIPETRENWLSAHDVSRPRPPRRLLSLRKVMAAWSKLEIVHFRRLVCCFDTTIGQWCGGVLSSHMQQSQNAVALSKIKSSTSSQKRSSISMWPYCSEKSAWSCSTNFDISTTMTLLAQLVCFFCGLSVSKRIILLVRCGFAVNFLMMEQAPKSVDVQYLLKLDWEVLILIQSCHSMH